MEQRTCSTLNPGHSLSFRSQADMKAPPVRFRSGRHQHSPNRAPLSPRGWEGRGRRGGEEGGERAGIFTSLTPSWVFFTSLVTVNYDIYEVFLETCLFTTLMHH